jgi:hypothetical protein
VEKQLTINKECGFPCMFVSIYKLHALELEELPYWFGKGNFKIKRVIKTLSLLVRENSKYGG